MVRSKINPSHICVFDFALSTVQTSFHENAHAQTNDHRRVSQKQVARLAVAANVKRHVVVVDTVLHNKKLDLLKFSLAIGDIGHGYCCMI